MLEKEIKDIVAKMTLEEKCKFVSGANFWNTEPVERLGVPSVMMTDGPYGMRKQAEDPDHLSLHASEPATCFPPGCVLACSWDPELAEKMGSALADEALAANVSILLGPAVNIKRSPLCGRNFEYLSEDPYLSGKMAAGHIKGLQKKSVGASIKHYVANNQEYRRMTSDSQVDERSLREIYLAGFELAIKESQPWTVMCSYNKINGTYASDNKYLLSDILRDEWGFEGYVMSDWGAVNDRVQGVIAGLDLEMPGDSPENSAKLAAAVKAGELDEAALDTCVERILKITYKYLENKPKKPLVNLEKNHALARKIASESMVLLKNENNILPLAKNTSIAVIGEFAVEPRFMGGGSSHINPTRVDKALEEMKKLAPHAKIVYEKGFVKESEDLEQALLDAAKKAAAAADAAVIFAGLPDIFESEGYDRDHLSLPANQLKLIDEVAAVQPNLILVLSNGSPVEMPFAAQAKAILEGYLGGQAGGGAAADILFGEVNPSGKLAESFPIQLEDNPSFINFPGEKDVVQYREGIFVGYRHYEKVKREVLFPFGFGLSYTSFEYSDLKLDKKSIKDNEILTVSLTVKNTGKLAGKEIVQLYVSDMNSIVIRPLKELKGFAKLELGAGEAKTVLITLDKRAFAFYDAELKDWRVQSGEFEILAASSSADVRLKETVSVESTTKLPVVFHLRSTISDLMEVPEGAEFAMKLMKGSFGFDTEAEGAGAGLGSDMMKMFSSMPVAVLASFSQGAISSASVQEQLDNLNKLYE